MLTEIENSFTSRVKFRKASDSVCGYSNNALSRIFFWHYSASLSFSLRIAPTVGGGALILGRRPSFISCCPSVNAYCTYVLWMAFLYTADRLLKLTKHIYHVSGNCRIVF